jgi:hypothetical protein
MKTRFAHTIEMTEDEYKAQMQVIQSGLSLLTSMVRWTAEAVEKEAARDHEIRMAELAKETCSVDPLKDTGDADE